MHTPKNYRSAPSPGGVRKRLSNGHYKNIRPFATPVVKHFMSVKECPICCRSFLTPNKGHALKGAIDHDHDRENTNVCSYRGRLCLNCNTAEGRAKKKANGDSDIHIQKWAEMRNVTPRRCKNYLERPPLFFLD
uniref:Recombination endonuclease VII n=1 Tax=viral metagenome TaxID=1070528 RepID=A0A6C0AC69_9ZZZZ